VNKTTTQETFTYLSALFYGSRGTRRELRRQVWHVNYVDHHGLIAHLTTRLNTYRHLHTIYAYIYGPRSFAMLDRPHGTRCRHHYATVNYYPRSDTNQKLNCLLSRPYLHQHTRDCFYTVRVGEHNFIDSSSSSSCYG